MNDFMKKLIIYYFCFVLSINIVLCQKQNSESDKKTQKIKSISQTQISNDWKLVDLDSFSFILPESMEDKKARGIDSSVWRFESDDIKLVIDSGMYKVTFPDAEDFESSTKQVVVDKIKGQYFAINYSKPKSLEAEIDEKDKQKPYLEAIVFKRNKYLFSSFWVQYKNPNQKEIAEKILYSIKFKN